MDPLGLLLAVVAVGLYPGGATLAVVAWSIAVAGRLPRAGVLDARAWAAIGAAGVAASMAPLPGSPAAALPPPGGPAPDIAAAAILLFAGGALVTAPPWPRRRLVALVIASVPPLILGLATASLTLRTAAGAPGEQLTAVRVLCAAALLLTAPAVLQPYAAHVHRAAQAAMLGAVAELALSVVLPESLHGVAAGIAVAAVVVAAGVYAALVAVSRRGQTVLVSLAGSCAAVATVLAVIAIQ